MIKKSRESKSLPGKHSNFLLYTGNDGKGPNVGANNYSPLPPRFFTKIAKQSIGVKT
jgi:hypothetical protein